MMIIPVEDPLITTSWSGVPALSVLRKALGGPLEHVPYWDRISVNGRTHPCVVFCNEEGKIHGLSVNDRANMLWYEVAPHMRRHDYLVGSIVVLWGDETFMREI